MCIVITEWAEVMQIQLTLWLCLLADQVQSVSKYNGQSYLAASRVHFFNPLTPNDHCSGRTAPLTSKRYILYIYSTNIGTGYFKHGI